MLLSVNDLIEVDTTRNGIIEYYISSIEDNIYNLIPRRSVSHDDLLSYKVTDGLLNNKSIIKDWHKIKNISPIFYTNTISTKFKVGDWVSIQHYDCDTPFIYYFVKQFCDYPNVVFKLMKGIDDPTRKCIQRGSFFYPEDELLNGLDDSIKIIKKPLLSEWCCQC